MYRSLRPPRPALALCATVALGLALAGCTLVVQDTQPSSTAAPLTHADGVACPVSQPNVSMSPDEYYIPTRNGYQNADATLFTQLWPGNTVILSPGGPGAIAADGTLAMKWPWYRTIPGAVVITGRRLDAPAPPMPVVTLRGPADGYSETGFHPGTLIFPSEGCWEVTGRVGEAGLTFVARVVNLPFDPVWPGWLPEGFSVRDTDVTALPRSIGLVFGPAAATTGELTVATTQGTWEDHKPYPAAAQQPAMLNGQPAVCAQGAWDDGRQWRMDADAAVIEWASGDYSYRVAQVDLGLRCDDLARIAESVN